MKGSLGLFLYQLFSGKGQPQELPESGAISGSVVWLVASDISEMRAFVNIARRLDTSGVDVHLLITGKADLQGALDLPDNMSFRLIPDGSRKAIADFLDAWNPVICFWSGIVLKPALIYQISRRAIPMILLNCSVGTLTKGKTALERHLIRKSVPVFRQAFALAYSSGGTCIRMGLPEERVHVSGPLLEGVVAPPCDEEDLDSFASMLSGRDIWLAAQVPDAEIELVLSVHEALRGTNRRLLLVLDPADKSTSDALAQSLTESGVKIGRRSKDDAITDHMQVYLADLEDELGLWFRIAPIAFMGGTYAINRPGCDPRQPAALGSAIVHGPRTAPFRGIYDHLHAQVPRAAKQAVTAEAMVRAVSELLSPDVAALQAHSAWEYASRGAELTDQITSLITQAVEMNG